MSRPLRRPRPGSASRRRVGVRYTAAQAAEHLQCSVPRLRAAAGELSVGRVVHGRWWFSWNEVEVLRRHLAGPVAGDEGIA